MKVLLVASSGGHLTQLYWLEPWWREHERTWVTFDTPDARDRLEAERVWYAHHPTNRHLPNLLRNTRLAWRVLQREQPDLVVSNGAGVALPFLAIARLMDVPTIFCEVYDRIDRPSVTGRLVSRWVDTVVLQWPEQKRIYPDGIVLGPIR